MPWERPPQIGPDEVSSLLVLTSAYKLYELASYREFYRLMIRDSQVKLVFPNNSEEVVIEAYTPASAVAAGRFDTVKRLFRIHDPEARPDNVLPFKPKT